MDLSVIIVNYNTAVLTLDCLKSVYSSNTGYNYEIILVDNHSSDGSIEKIRTQYPQVDCIENEGNLGFSKANNQGIKQANGKYILLLNSDTVLSEDTIAIMIDFMNQHPNVGASGCKVELPNGELDKACKRGFPTPSASFYYAFGFSKLFPNKPKFNKYQLGYKDPDVDYPVDCLVGAFMLVRKTVIDQVGMLDEEFFMYGEDIDWCYRIKQAGWEIYYYPFTKIIHVKGASSQKKPFRIIYEFHYSMLLFHRKHYKQQYSWVINILVYAGVGLKFTIALLRNRLTIFKRNNEKVKNDNSFGV